jgi:dCMP deaminase
VTRVSLDNYLMNVAMVIRSRSDWPGTHVGCVAAVDGMIRSTGYNGTPKGWEFPKVLRLGPGEFPDKETMAYYKPLYCHAEENAIVQAARAGVCLNGSTFYVTMSPCIQCARMLINVGCKRVVFHDEWEGVESTRAMELLVGSGINWEMLKLPQ